MTYYQRLQNSIDYIEEHLQEDMSLDAVAYQACFSLTHFYRIFKAIIGEPIKEYIRKRRLSHAALELVRTQKGILTIALDYRFESQEAFTRAFVKQFGITPGRYRKQNKEIIYFEKADLALIQRNTINGVQVMNTTKFKEPQVIIRKEFHVIGMEFETTVRDNIDNETIPAFWQEVFIPRMGEIKHIVDKKYSMGIEREAEGKLYHFACFEVEKIEDVPEGMSARTIPAGKCLVFRVGEASTAKDTEEFFEYLYGTWFPRSGYEPDGDYEYEIYEYVSEEVGIIDHYIPVK